MSRVPPEALTPTEVAAELRGDIAENLAAIDLLFMRSIGIEPATAAWIEKERRRRIAALEWALSYAAGLSNMADAERLSDAATSAGNNT